MGTAALAIGTESREARFEAVALAHTDSIYRSALYLAGNESDAQDLVQDTYLRAYKFFDKFEEGTNCKAWLLKILRNTFINTIRHNKKRSGIIYLSEIEEQGRQLPSNSNTEDSVFRDLFDDGITAAMDELPDSYRGAILLADVEKLSYREIADIMDCPIGTVMSRIHRGRNLLRESLKYYAAAHGYTEDERPESQSVGYM